MRYIVSYDLNKQGQNYEALWKALRELNATRILYSQYVFRHNNTNCVAVRDHLKRFIDSNDRLLVTELDGTGWAGFNLMADLNTI